MIRYKQLADNVLLDITEGRLVAGLRMPSIRQFAKLHNVSMTTVLNCYSSLHEQGWLSVKAQSGYFVARPLTVSNDPDFPKFSAKITVPKPYAQIKNSYIDSPFYTAQLAPSLIPREVLNRCFHRGNLRSVNTDYQYPVINGELNLRNALGKHISDSYFSLSAEEIAITNGCIDAVRSAIEVVSEPGGTIAITSPCFSGLLNLLLSMKRKVLEIPCHNAELDLDQLETYMKKGVLKAALFNASFINPHGLCLSPEQKKSIAGLAEQYQVPIIEDDVYIELGFNGFKPRPIKYWDDKGWVIWCGSISKSVAPSYRLGWCVPGRFLKSYLHHRKVNSLAVNVPVQAAFFEFINSGQYSKHLRKISLNLSQQALDYQSCIAENLPSHTQISSLQGGMVIWLQIKGLNAVGLCEKANSYKVSVKGGAEFSTLPLYLDCVRLNIGWPLSCEITPGVTVRDQLKVLCDLINLQLSCSEV